MDNSIAFKSKINFVNLNTFEEVVGGQKIHHLSRDILKASSFYSYDIRTCTGGGVVSPNKHEACGFHILDCYENNVNLNKIIKKIFKYAKVDKPERALLIGGKLTSSAPLSLQNFKEIKNKLKDKIHKITLFEEHNSFLGQSSFHYDLKTDTWTILSQYAHKEERGTEVLTPELLKRAYKKIKIADGDELYINRKKVLKTEFPEFFESSTIFDYAKKYWHKIFRN